jgi:hypothetical protein
VTVCHPPPNREILSAIPFYICILLFQCCITVDTVCALLATAERYIQYKCTKFLIQKVNNDTFLRYSVSLLIFQDIPFLLLIVLGSRVCGWPREWGELPKMVNFDSHFLETCGHDQKGFENFSQVPVLYNWIFGHWTEGPQDPLGLLSKGSLYSYIFT